MSTRRFRRLSCAALAVGIALYWTGMSWSFHRQHQAQILERTLLLKKIDAARLKQERLQALIEQRRAEIFLRQKAVNSRGDFWMPRELDRWRMQKSVHREG